MNRGPAVFLDRDGTLNEEKDYLFRREEWKWIPGAVEALGEFKGMGFRLIVLSNQSGIARGYYSSADVDRLHEWVNQNLATHGLVIDGFYYCPHAPTAEGEGGCSCRKPSLGLVHRAADDFNVSLATSYMVGDKASDVEMGWRAGMTALLVLTGYGHRERSKVPSDTPVIANLPAAAAWVKAHRTLS